MKKRVKTKKKNSSQVRNVGLILFFTLVIAIVAILPYVPANTFSFGASIPFTPAPAKNSLQLETFQLTPTPGAQFSAVTQNPTTSQITLKPTSQSSTPTTAAPSVQGPNPATCAGYVNSGVPLPSNCECPDIYIICPYTTSDPTDVTVGPNGCLDPLFVGDPPKKGKFCIDKPVVYLYPTTPTFVDVTVRTAGSVVVSDPHYPTGGWKHVLAQPAGALTYQGRGYLELFYETSVTTFDKPSEGITIPTNQLHEKLNTILDQLGLVSNEKQEFLTYWIPRLQTLHSPYIFFSLLSSSSKEAVDTVDISPRPDTMIDFIAYFKPVESMTTDSSFMLPKAQQRHGFVAVEWGGVIDK